MRRTLNSGTRLCNRDSAPLVTQGRGIRFALERAMAMCIRFLPERSSSCSLLAGAVWLFMPRRPITHPPGVLVSEVPAQKDITWKSLGNVAGWNLTAVAEYHLRGRVLGTKRYYGDPNSDLVPIDVAVGWNRMTDQAVLDQFEISMGNRFFFYSGAASPRFRRRRSRSPPRIIT